MLAGAEANCPEDQIGETTEGICIRPSEPALTFEVGRHHG